ncbi:MAG: hypothetical protein AABX82_07345 [Nanoarchaeota archaeon]
MGELTIFNISYDWYEGDHDEVLLAKAVESQEFETDLTEARKFAESLKGKEIHEGSYLGKGYSVECLPQFYEQIIWFLTEKKSYAICSMDEDTKYIIDDGSNKKIEIRKKEEKVEWRDL